MTTVGTLFIAISAIVFAPPLVLGIITTVGLQAAMNMLVVTALVPTKGIALPLLSNGGTGWLLTALCIGLIDAIDRTNKPTTSMQEYRYPTATTHA